MIRCFSTFLTLLLALPPLLAVEQTDANVLVGTPWVGALIQRGRTLNLNFTIELDCRTPPYGNGLSKLDNVTVPGFAPAQTSVELIDEVKRVLPGVDAFPDEKNPRIIHLVEKSLYKPDGYGLGQKATIKLDGTQEDLLDEISARTAGAIRETRGGALVSVAWVSTTPYTPAKVDCVNCTYRTILSSATVADGSGSILWESREYIGINKAPVIEVAFPSQSVELPPAQFETLETLLNDCGPKLRLYFTIERDTNNQGGAPLSHFNVREGSIDTNSPDGLFGGLRRRYPGVRIFRDPLNSEVVHIVEASLPPGSNIMDQKVSLRFQGTFASLVGRLGGRGNTAVVPGSGPAANQFRQTRMLVDAKDEQYRDVLCEFASLKDAPTILWVADYYHLDSRFLAKNSVQVGIGPSVDSGTTRPSGN